MNLQESVDTKVTYGGSVGTGSDRATIDVRVTGKRRRLRMNPSREKLVREKALRG